MFGNIKAKLAVAAVVALGAVAAPSGASATAFPTLPAGATATCWSTTSVTGPCITSDVVTSFSGNVTLTNAGGLSITCTLTVSTLRHLAAAPVGRAEATVNSPFTGCTVAGFPNCVITAVPLDLPWRGQAANYTGPPNPPANGKYLFINVRFQNTFGANCPVPAGTVLDESGLLALRLLPVPGPITAATVTAPYNQVTGTTPATISGTLTKTAGPGIFAV